MRKKIQKILFCLLLASCLSALQGQIPVEFSIKPPVNPEKETKSYYSDLNTDIPWSGGYNNVSDIQAAYNNARTGENSQLGTSIPMLTMPNQATWDGMSVDEKGLWLINEERTARGLDPLAAIEHNVDSIAQWYSAYLVTNDTFAHEADGRTPWERIQSPTKIAACYDYIGVAENLSVYVNSSDNFPATLARAIYNHIYYDLSCCSSLHRRLILFYPYDDNSGSAGEEGFLGVGYTKGTNYQGPFSQVYNYVEMYVFNVFDPCASWVYTSESPVISDNSRITIYPVPAVNNIFIECANMPIENVELTDLQGKSIINQQFSERSGKIILAVPEHLKGFYFLKIIQNNDIIIRKMLIE